MEAAIFRHDFLHGAFASHVQEPLTVAIHYRDRKQEAELSIRLIFIIVTCAENAVIPFRAKRLIEHAVNAVRGLEPVINFKRGPPLCSLTSER
jgi:hypothetical protein